MLHAVAPKLRLDGVGGLKGVDGVGGLDALGGVCGVPSERIANILIGVVPAEIVVLYS